jgi:hypothetical protein
LCGFCFALAHLNAVGGMNKKWYDKKINNFDLLDATAAVAAPRTWVLWVLYSAAPGRVAV